MCNSVKIILGDNWWLTLAAEFSQPGNCATVIVDTVVLGKCQALYVPRSLYFLAM